MEIRLVSLMKQRKQNFFPEELNVKTKLFYSTKEELLIKGYFVVIGKKIKMTRMNYNIGTVA